MKSTKLKFFEIVNKKNNSQTEKPVKILDNNIIDINSQSNCSSGTDQSDVNNNIRKKVIMNKNHLTDSKLKETTFIGETDDNTHIKSDRDNSKLHNSVIIKQESSNIRRFNLLVDKNKENKKILNNSKSKINKTLPQKKISFNENCELITESNIVIRESLAKITKKISIETVKEESDIKSHYSTIQQDNDSQKENLKSINIKPKLNKLIYLYDKEINKIKIVNSSQKTRNISLLYSAKEENNNEFSSNISKTDQKLKSVDETSDIRKYNLIEKSIVYTLNSIESHIESKKKKKNKDFLFNFMKSSIKVKLKKDVDENNDQIIEKETIKNLSVRIINFQINTYPFFKYFNNTYFDIYSHMVDNILKQKYLLNDFNSAINKLVLSDEQYDNLKMFESVINCKRSSIFTYGNLLKQSTFVHHPVFLGVSNMNHFNKYLILDKDDEDKSSCTDKTEDLLNDSIISNNINKSKLTKRSSTVLLNHINLNSNVSKLRRKSSLTSKNILLFKPRNSIKYSKDSANSLEGDRFPKKRLSGKMQLFQFNNDKSNIRNLYNNDFSILQNESFFHNNGELKLDESHVQKLKSLHKKTIERKKTLKKPVVTFNISSDNKKIPYRKKESIIARTHDIKSNLLSNKGTLECLVMYIKEENFHRFKETLQRHTLNIDSRTENEATLLIHACQCGCFKIAHHLLVLGSEVNTQDIDLNTPLHYALMQKNYKLADLLIQYGADQTLKNIDNQTPWQVLINRNVE